MGFRRSLAALTALSREEEEEILIGGLSRHVAELDGAEEATARTWLAAS